MDTPTGLNRTRGRVPADLIGTAWDGAVATGEPVLFPRARRSYRKMLDDPSFLLPRDHVLLKLATAQEEANNLKEARASYERLVQEYPGSVYAGEARHPPFTREGQACGRARVMGASRPRRQ